MKRMLLTLAGLAVLAIPLAAQWLGQPVWNTPKGGTGITISGDYARPKAGFDAGAGDGDAWGARAAFALGTLTLTGGVSTWKPDGAAESFTSLGGDADFRLVGGTLLPVAVNFQLGATRTDSANAIPARTRVIGAVGFSVPLPMPSVNIEPYFSPGVRYEDPVPSGGSSTEFGYAIGANLSFGVLGAHIAYDHENLKGGGSRGVWGVGLHVGLHAPLGM